MKKSSLSKSRFDYEKVLRTKSKYKPPYEDRAVKCKTLNNLQIVVLIVFSSTGAVLFYRKGDNPASVIRKGNDPGLDAVSKRSSISLADFGFSDGAIIVSAPDTKDLIIRNTDEDDDMAAKDIGAVVFYGRPSGKKIHVRVVCNRGSNGTCEQFSVESLDELWMLRAVVEPILVSWKLRFSWPNFLELIYGVTIIIKDDSSKSGD